MATSDHRAEAERLLARPGRDDTPGSTARDLAAAQVHAVLANAGVQVGMSDLFSAGGQDLLARVALTPESRARVDSALR